MKTYLFFLLALAISKPSFAESMSDQTSLFYRISTTNSYVSTSMDGVADQQTIFVIGNGEYKAGGMASPPKSKIVIDYVIGQFSKINSKMSTFLNVNQMNECVRILAGAQDNKFFWFNFTFEKGFVSTDESGLKIRFVNLGNLYQIRSISCGLASQ